jgi:hypothetical protein
MIPSIDPDLDFHVEHTHDDGSAHAMEPVPHDAAEHDPERRWARGQVFQCRDCDARVSLIPREES